LITGGEDAILPPILPTRLADAMGMRRVGEHRRRGPHSVMVQWPGLGHNLVNQPFVREQAYTFLMTRGRRLPPVHGGVPHRDSARRSAAPARAAQRSSPLSVASARLSAPYAT